MALGGYDSGCMYSPEEISRKDWLAEFHAAGLRHGLETEGRLLHSSDHVLLVVARNGTSVEKKAAVSNIAKGLDPETVLLELAESLP